jgi:hypothetical protein
VSRVRSLSWLGRILNDMDRRNTDNQDDSIALNVDLKPTEERQ